MEKLISLLFVLLVTGQFARSQDNLLPAKYEPVKEVYGDLNKDGIAEKVVVYNMGPDTTQFDGVDREVIIFKKLKDKWVIWQRSVKAVGNSKDGGMNSDPFWDMEIKNGILIIKQAGGSSWKWSKIDKYRFQDNTFELIGCNSFYGRICLYWEEFDYNVSTGKINVRKEYETCENKKQEISKRENESFIHKIKDKITLQNRADVEMEIVSPKYKHSLYL